ncbi:scavenger receptor class F member 1-like [Haliotis rubra]|uniref:scavenger receptor class F member 1-like n=1 Tax=Haliotis rubra TaxID=36100 RepID=UPI001EE53B77|nr:scavenger receptor class F member 1-like [Haliotis rubra]
MKRYPISKDSVLQVPCVKGLCLAATLYQRTLSCSYPVSKSCLAGTLTLVPQSQSCQATGDNSRQKHQVSLQAVSMGSQVLSVAVILWCQWIQNVHVTASSTSVPCTNCDGNNVTCVDGVCPPRCVNVTSSGECLQCLESRFYGKQCEHNCPDTCLNSHCQVNNTRVVCTEGCVAGKKGDNCAVNCPTACTQCERYGAGCTGPCQNPQYYGQHCRTPCPSNCTDGCNRITGECGSCEPGYTGDKCDVTCPYNCTGGCNRTTGECDSCEPGYTGDKCDVTCPDNCKGGCNRITGECDSCEPGYTGDKCDVTCPPNCRGGCDRITGECGSCKPGYTGDKCGGRRIQDGKLEWLM